MKSSVRRQMWASFWTALSEQFRETSAERRVGARGGRARTHIQGPTAVFWDELSNKFLFISVTGKICKTQGPLRFFWPISLNNSQYFSFCQAKPIQWCIGTNTARCVADGTQMILPEWEILRLGEQLLKRINLGGVGAIDRFFKIPWFYILILPLTRLSHIYA